ncbi:MAG: YggS family pyridoxal phosphate-dependent enzyme [Bacteroidetes bacterium]|nr:YggS family pyridoxal phosphate-dependent enzyme [Bacteroidota bacterium]MCB9227788.1 YggS family pyridoxal phosphate-dependent enzyme [Chitinophagales bacterium]
MVNKQALKEIDNTCKRYNAQLVAVTKKRSIEEVSELYELGYHVFAENRVQDLLEKKELLPNNIQWHLIGHLQRNKVKYIVPFVKLIHSVDSIRLLSEINKEAKKVNKTIDCLLQFHVAQEESKYGTAPENIDAFMSDLKTIEIDNIKIRGIMGMASFTDNQNQIRKEFEQLKSIFEMLKKEYLKEDNFSILSMGMSSDYKIALEEGSTLVRVGSALFE